MIIKKINKGDYVDTNQLLAFDHVVRHGSFSKAARMMDISQPTISIRIKNLEEEVGGELFKRGGNKLELSELGRTFLPFAQQAIGTINKGMEQAKLAKEGRGGKIAIGTLPTLADHYFSSTLATLYKTHPHIGIVVHTGHNQELLEMLYEGYVKLCVMTYPFFNTELRSLLHIREPLLLVTHPDHPLAQKDEIELNDIDDRANPYLLVDWSVDAKRVQREMLTGRNDFEVPPQTAYDLLKSGMGVALLTETMVAKDIDQGTLVSLSVKAFPKLYRESALVQLKKEKEISSSLRTFINVFSDQIESEKSCELKSFTF
ncbi:LysR family transcriptional regulator [Fictibacillus halophilus]|uniref:LysR family transcriptional regulator n=1 Tax=Fictibacillus halophilus TaxID=1610490 RepID=UPI001CF9EDA2|nr:LysR family transcriptional regulator [Fictibacillus halophilus]